MKIGLLTQWFDPETGPAALPGVYAREFVRQGHSVKVLTGYPNYPQGSLYPGYKMRPRASENRDGVRVTRVPLFPSHNGSAVGRFTNYASFAASASILGAGALRGVDAIWVYNSPPTVAVPQILHSRYGKTPVFLHIQDLWPDSLLESGMFPTGPAARFASRVIESVVKLMERRAAIIGVISPSVRELVLERNPTLDPERIIYAPNPTNESLYRPLSSIRNELGITRADEAPVEFMYAGAIGEVQGLDTLLEAAALLKHRDDIKITLYGDGIRRVRLEAEAQELDLRNVVFAGRIPQEAVPEAMARADVQLVSLASRPFLRHTTPSKLPAILASASPVLGQIEGDAAALIERSGAGVTVTPGDSAALASALARFADLTPAERAEYGTRAVTYYNTELSAMAAATRIIQALTSASRL